jgi:hypothetical protein
MAEEDRSSVQQREKARGALRALYLGEVASIGRRRSDALREADDQLDKLAKLLTNAVDAGIGIAEIARASDVSRPTLYQLKARYSEDPGDLRLAVLGATLDGGTADEIADRLRRSRDEVEALLRDFEDKDWVGWDVGSSEEGDEMIWHLTGRGLGALEEWTFDPAADESEPTGER